MISYSIDNFLSTFDIPFPNYLKIDVDGIEHQICQDPVKGSELANYIFSK